MKIKTRRYYIYYLACMGAFIVNILPLRFTLWLAGLVGEAVFALLKKERQRTLDNLKRSFPEKPDVEIENRKSRFLEHM